MFAEKIIASVAYVDMVELMFSHKFDNIERGNNITAIFLAR